MKFIMAILITTFLVASSSVGAHEGIATSHRDAIQKAMKKHIDQIMEYNGNGKFPVFDPTEKTLIQLRVSDSLILAHASRATSDLFLAPPDQFPGFQAIKIGAANTGEHHEHQTRTSTKSLQHR